MRDLIGHSLRRIEDRRFLTGAGRYTEDTQVPGEAFLQVVRSPHAHAEVRRIDVSQTGGVLGVFTAADLAGLGPIPCQVKVPTTGPMLVPERFA